MLTALELENFKGIAARQRVDFAPLTCLVGPNSAGKSTIFQALLYLHELLERGDADVDRTELGGSVIELGGFARLVHRHEANRSIVLRTEFATPDTLERFGRELTNFPFPNLDDEIDSAWLELTIKIKSTKSFRGALVDRVVVGVGGEPQPLVIMEAGVSLRVGEPLNVRINLGHPLLAETAQNVADDWERIAIPEEVLRLARKAEDIDLDSVSRPDDWPGLRESRVLPVFTVSRFRLSALPHPSEPLRVVPFGDVDDLRTDEEHLQELGAQASMKDHARLESIREEIRSRERAVSQVRTFLEMAVLGTTAQLLALLREASYIGPLRTIPPRGFLYERVGRITSWADGLTAWDLLLSNRGSLVEDTNRWLRRLNAGCQVVVQQLFDGGAEAEELSDRHVDKTVRRLLLDTGAGSLVLPSEVGAGVSQIIPVVVAALEGRASLSLVEQPEIHVHPAMQVGLGDLFIDAVAPKGGRRTILVETHSEHLILRLLRRIRETTEKELRDGAPTFVADKLSVLYVESHLEGVEISRLRVDEHGEFIDSWPRGFFDERFPEIYEK